jgi:hypothetical protein
MTVLLTCRFVALVAFSSQHANELSHDGSGATERAHRGPTALLAGGKQS